MVNEPSVFELSKFDCKKKKTKNKKKKNVDRKSKKLTNEIYQSEPRPLKRKNQSTESTGGSIFSAYTLGDWSWIGTRLFDLIFDFLSFKQTMQTLIRRRVLFAKALQITFSIASDVTGKKLKIARL